jgi:hypothetical protein
MVVVVVVCWMCLDCTTLVRVMMMDGAWLLAGGR